MQIDKRSVTKRHQSTRILYCIPLIFVANNFILSINLLSSVISVESFLLYSSSLMGSIKLPPHCKRVWTIRVKLPIALIHSTLETVLNFGNE